MFLFIVPRLHASPGYEDLQNNYTTVGSNTQFITNYEAKANPYDRDVDEYVYKDFGSGYFTDFEHLFDMFWDGASHNTAGWMMFWGLSNDLDDAYAWTNGLKIYGEEFSSQVKYTLTDVGGASDNTGWITFHVWYYCRVQRSGTTVTLKIYSSEVLRDAGGSPDVDTLSITGATTAYRYSYALSSWNSGNADRDTYGNIKNLDLQGIVETKSPSSCSGDWVDPTNAYADGGGSASTSTDGAQESYSGYGFDITAESILKVRVRLDAWTLGNEQIKLYVSEDGGSSWLATTWTSDSLTGSEVTYWVDVTSWTTWTDDKINNDKIWVKVEMVKVGGGNWVYLDWIPIEVSYVAGVAWDVTFYFTDGGVLRVDNVTIVNGTVNNYPNGTVIELVAIVEGNLTYGFNKFTWDSNSSTSNPYNLTVTADLTAWCYFGEIAEAENRFALAVALGVTLAVGTACVALVLIIRYRREEEPF